MVGWHHQLDRHEFEQALGVGDGQGSLVCCSPWGQKESDMTERLDRTELKQLHCPNDFQNNLLNIMFPFSLQPISFSHCHTITVLLYFQSSNHVQSNLMFNLKNSVFSLS